MPGFEVAVVERLSAKARLDPVQYPAIVATSIYTIHWEKARKEMSMQLENGLVEFSLADVQAGQFPRVSATMQQLVRREPEWMRRGLTQTASGYGKKLNSGLMIRFEGKERRIYTTIYSNVGSSWFVYRGQKIYVD